MNSRFVHVESVSAANSVKSQMAIQEMFINALPTVRCSSDGVNAWKASDLLGLQQTTMVRHS